MILNPQHSSSEEEQQNVAPPRAFDDSSYRLLRRTLINSVANKVVAFGGIFVILCIIAILVVIIRETVPAFRDPTISPLGTFRISSPQAIRGVVADDLGQTVTTLSSDGALRTYFANQGWQVAQPEPVLLSSVPVRSFWNSNGSSLFLGTVDGRVVEAKLSLESTYRDGKQQIKPSVAVLRTVVVDEVEHRPVLGVVAATIKSEPLIIAQLDGHTLAVQRPAKTKRLMDTGNATTAIQQLVVPVAADISAFAIDAHAEKLLVGVSDGTLLLYGLRALEKPEQMIFAAESHLSGISALAGLIGGHTWIVADTSGRVQSWMLVKGTSGERLQKIHDFDRHEGAVVGIARSQRNRSFVTVDAVGHAALHFSTTGETLLHRDVTAADLELLMLSPRGSMLSSLDSEGDLSIYQLSNPHPEVSLRALFGRLWYEGYNEPAYVWQSSGGTDDFEAKFSLIPLLFGTLKGTVYALLVAVPFAVLAALFVSQFMGPRMRSLVKPVIELMAALPSVVIGFIAGLWLAPHLQPVMPGLLIAPGVLFVVIIIAVLLFRMAPISFRVRFRSGRELLLLLPAVALGAVASIWVGATLEGMLLGPSYSQWLFNSFGVVVDQRSSIVVGIAMGFAIIPIIFTIAEESLSAVPKHLSAASLALGANRWETALRIVLPAATPGIFSAIMVGFGRAVGETMVVLMATGNTPILDASPFNGFRALSANIAVELPEAPEGGTLYRVLFFSAFLLFALTFVVNTITEIIRVRLRERYKQL